MDGDAPQWRDMDAEERAIAYSPSQALPDGDLAPFLQAYTEKSAAAYARHPEFRTLVYGPKPANSVDIVIPESRMPVPLHVFIHGGYWQELSKLESFFPATDTLSAGFGFAAVDYTLAPKATIDEIVEECLSAVRLLMQNARDLGIDQKRVVLSGSSAGAHLAAMCGLRLPKEFQPKGVALVSGIYELEPLVETYVNDAVGMSVEDAKRNSPALADLKGFPPAVIACGGSETDEFKRQSRGFAALLRSAARPVQVIEMSHRNHFDIVDDLANASPLGRALIELASE